MKRIHAILAVAACSAVVTGVALAQQTEQPRPQQQQATALSPGDKLFVDAAFDINQGEILLGKLAQEKGTTAAVKQYGARMEKDHTAALDDLARMHYGSELPHFIEEMTGALKLCKLRYWFQNPAISTNSRL